MSMLYLQKGCIMLKNIATNTDSSESKKPLTKAELAHNVARILIELHLESKVIIIADRPVIFLSILRKHWLSIGRKLQRERSSTFDQTKIRVLSERLNYIYDVRFSSTSKPDSGILVVDHTHTFADSSAYVLICTLEHKTEVVNKAQQNKIEFSAVV